MNMNKQKTDVILMNVKNYQDYIESSEKKKQQYNTRILIVT